MNFMCGSYLKVNSEIKQSKRNGKQNVWPLRTFRIWQFENYRFYWFLLQDWWSRYVAAIYIWGCWHWRRWIYNRITLLFRIIMLLLFRTTKSLLFSRITSILLLYTNQVGLLTRRKWNGWPGGHRLSHNNHFTTNTGAWYWVSTHNSPFTINSGAWYWVSAVLVSAQDIVWYWADTIRPKACNERDGSGPIRRSGRSI